LSRHKSFTQSKGLIPTVASYNWTTSWVLIISERNTAGQAKAQKVAPDVWLAERISSGHNYNHGEEACIYPGVRGRSQTALAGHRDEVPFLDTEGREVRTLAVGVKDRHRLFIGT
jgi:hypothetical protein